MKRQQLFLKLTLAVLLIAPQAVKAQFNWPYKNVNGTLVTEVPQRKAGQQSAIGRTTPKL